MKRVTAYSNQQFQVPGYQYAEPGLAMKYRTDSGQMGNEENEQLFAMVSALFSVAVFEQREERLSLKDGEGEPFFYFSKPYEPFCKENLSFLLKLLSSFNYKSGLQSLLSDNLIHSSQYKHLRVNLDHNKDDHLKATFHIAYVS
jgi:Gpi16 subunit, GPI transamidase component